MELACAASHTAGNTGHACGKKRVKSLQHRSGITHRETSATASISQSSHKLNPPEPIQLKLHSSQALQIHLGKKCKPVKCDCIFPQKKHPPPASWHPKELLSQEHIPCESASNKSRRTQQFPLSTLLHEKVKPTVSAVCALTRSVLWQVLKAFPVPNPNGKFLWRQQLFMPKNGIW